MVIQREQRSYQTVTQGQLWGSLATGAVVWSLHLVASYALISLACERDWLGATAGGFAPARWWLLGLTVVAAVVVLAAGLTAYGHWRQLRRTAAPQRGEPEGRFHFMAWLGVLFNSLFLLAILVSLLPVLFLPLCG